MNKKKKWFIGMNCNSPSNRKKVLFIGSVTSQKEFKVYTDLIVEEIMYLYFRFFTNNHSTKMCPRWVPNKLQ